MAKHKCEAKYVCRVGACGEDIVVVDKWVAVAIAGEHLEEPNQLATKGAEALDNRRVEAAVAAERKRDVLVVLALFLEELEDRGWRGLLLQGSVSLGSGKSFSLPLANAGGPPGERSNSP